MTPAVIGLLSKMGFFPRSTASLTFGFIIPEMIAQVKKGDSKSDPSPVQNAWEDLPDDQSIAEAGGLDCFVRGRRRPDNRFRFYTIAAMWCPACRLHDEAMVALQRRRGDVDYTRIDANGALVLSPKGIPDTLLQYDKCSFVMRISGFFSLPQLEENMLKLQRWCSLVEGVPEEENGKLDCTPIPFPPDPESPPSEQPPPPPLRLRRRPVPPLYREPRFFEDEDRVDYA